MKNFADEINKIINNKFLFFSIAIFGVFYVFVFSWTPSSYGIALDHIRAENTGFNIGVPRPIRSDEWAVLTPLVQAVINNDFGRINNISFYGEDFRMNYGLPIFDWGLLFKPTFVGFLFLDPAYAYSLHWFLVSLLFLLGYALLLRRIGLSSLHAALLSIALYFTGFSQFWWTILGPVLAIFPWVVVVLLARGISFPLRIFLFYWVSACWFMGNLYPPVIISLAFVGGLLFLGWGDIWRRKFHFACLVVAGAASAATAAFYLRDYLQAASSTLYPGARNVGGGSVPWRELASYFFPFSNFDVRYESVIGQNICEVGTAATALGLLAICFIDYSKIPVLIRSSSQAQRWRTYLISVGLVMMLAWMTIPISPSVGKIILWNQVQPERMDYAFGFLLLIALSLSIKSLGLRWSVIRFFAYVGLVVLGWIALKRPFSNNIVWSLNDLVVVASALPLLWFWSRGRMEAKTSVFSVAALSGVIVVGAFNPLQSAAPIFAKHDTPFVRALAHEQEANAGVLVYPGPGAVYNGIGFRSVAHVTSVPNLSLWRQYYPELASEVFLNIFNRYSHISLIDGSSPRLLAPDNIGVPVNTFREEWVFIPNGLTTGGSSAVWLAPGHYFRGYFSSPRVGYLSHVSPLLGNGGYMSDGILGLRVCAASGCASGSRDLKDSLDNSYLIFSLDTQLLVERNERIYYEFRLKDAVNPVAFWSHVSADASSEMEGGDSVTFAQPRLRLMLSDGR